MCVLCVCGASSENAICVSVQSGVSVVFVSRGVSLKKISGHGTLTHNRYNYAAA